MKTMFLVKVAGQYLTLTPAQYEKYLIFGKVK